MSGENPEEDAQRRAERPALPQVLLNYTIPPVTGRTIDVGPGDNLQSALNRARPGDEVVLAAGATFTGNFTLPATTGGWILVRSEKLGVLPPAGTRVAAMHADFMPKIVTPNTSAAIRTVIGTRGWWLAGIEVTVAPTVTAQQYGLVFLGEAGAPQRTMADVPQDLVLDRMYIHGQATTNMSRCVALNSGRTQISDSYLVDCHGKGFDSQAIAGWNGPGPYKIVNNSLQGAGENLIFGGADPAIPNLVPSDIEIRGNHFYTPVAWKGVWTKKNLLEFKNASRVLIEGNVFDGSWTDGQTGWAVIFKSENQSGGCNWCRTTDVTFQRNLIRNVGAGINIAPAGPHAPVDTAPRRIVIRETVIEDVGEPPFAGDQRGFMVLAGISHVLIERTVLAGRLKAALILEGGTPIQIRDNVWARGDYGVIGNARSPGQPTIAAYAPNVLWSGVTFVGASNGTYPLGTRWVATEAAAPLAAQIRNVVRIATFGVATP